MNLHRMLRARAADKRPVTVGLIGAGKFGSMFLASAQRTPGMQVVGIADLSLPRARAALARVGWPEAQYAAPSFDAALRDGSTALVEDALALIADPRIEVIVECTGHPAAGIRHALAAIAHGKHIVMVNVEADVLAGPLLAEKARAAGTVYSMAYGDQPALVCEIVDTLRAEGFTVIAAGKGTKYLPAYHASTPETVWGHYGLTEEQARIGGMNPQMFNSFLDGTKSGIEMAAIANATGLAPPEDGLDFPPCGVQDLPRVFAGGTKDGGTKEGGGRVEVISSLERDGRPVVGDLRWGVYAVFEGGTDYIHRCFAEYGVATDPSGRFAALWRPYHFIGLELGISVASAALRREPTGCADTWSGDVAATAKRDLAAGEVLDGEGGAMVWGKCIPAARSLALGALPIGLAHGVPLKRAVKAGGTVGYADVALDEASEAVRIRRAMEAAARLARAAE